MARHKTSRNDKHYLRQGVDPRVTQDRDLDLTNSQNDVEPKPFLSHIEAPLVFNILMQFNL